MTPISNDEPHPSLMVNGPKIKKYECGWHLVDIRWLYKPRNAMAPPLRLEINAKRI